MERWHRLISKKFLHSSLPEILQLRKRLSVSATNGPGINGSRIVGIVGRNSGDQNGGLGRKAKKRKLREHKTDIDRGASWQDLKGTDQYIGMKVANINHCTTDWARCERSVSFANVIYQRHHECTDKLRTNTPTSRQSHMSAGSVICFFVDADLNKYIFFVDAAGTSF